MFNDKNKNPITKYCVPISCRYYRLHKAKENYRIFTNQQRREDSVDGSLSESIAGVNPAAMAYDNPVFLDKTLESTNEQSNDDDVEVNSIPFNSPKQERDRSSNNGKFKSNESNNSFPLKNGTFFSHSSKDESDPKAFEPLPSVLEKGNRVGNHYESTQALDTPDGEHLQNGDETEDLTFGRMLHF